MAENSKSPADDGVLSPDDIEVIANMPKSKPASVRGVVKLVRIPEKSNGLYIYFSDVPSQKQIQVLIDPKSFDGGPYNSQSFKIIEEEFQQLVGKTVTFNGYVRRFRNNNDWHMVSISKRNQFIIEDAKDQTGKAVEN